MRALSVLPLATLVAALLVVGLSVDSAAAMGTACSTGQVVKTKSYVFALSIGPVETMYTPAQVRAKHPKSGEVMLSGTMSAMHMSSSSERHLEVHICTHGGAVVTGAHPTIEINDPAAKAMKMTMLPVATMEGIGMGRSDYHYGNNVELTAGHHITVTVTLNAQRAVFHTTVAKTGMHMK